MEEIVRTTAFHFSAFLPPAPVAVAWSLAESLAPLAAGPYRPRCVSKCRAAAGRRRAGRNVTTAAAAAAAAAVIRGILFFRKREVD